MMVGGSARTAPVTQRRRKTRVGQHAQGPVLVDVDDHGVTRLTGAEIGDDAVTTGVGVLHRALVAVDDEGAVGTGGRGSIHAHDPARGV